MKTQTLRDNSMHSFMSSKKILELNPEHFVVQHLQKTFSRDPANLSITNLPWILYDTALLMSGFSLEDPKSLTQRIYQVIGETVEKERNDGIGGRAEARGSHD